MPETFLRILSFVFFVVLIPIIRRADSSIFNETFGKVGRALLPT
jgi:hypothetical protein